MAEISSPGFLRHIRDCNNAVLPGERLPFRLGGAQVGWILPNLAAELRAWPAVTQADGAVVLHEPAALPAVAKELAERGFYRWRHEAFDIRPSADGPVLAQIDRGAIPSFGVVAMGVHVNGLVRRADGLHLWVARRAANKQLDPGKLDHLVAGGIPAGLDAEATLVKEGAEEAGIPGDLTRGARHVATIGYAMERSEGLRRDLLFCYDLDLPETFEPCAVDGEVEAFELWPIARVLDAVRDSDAFKFNVNLVLIDLFLRLGMIPGDEAALLRTALHGL